MELNQQDAQILVAILYIRMLDINMNPISPSYNLLAVRRSVSTQILINS